MLAYLINACRFGAVVLIVSVILPAIADRDFEVITSSSISSSNALISKCCTAQQTLWPIDDNALPVRYECRSDDNADIEDPPIVQPLQHHCAWAVEAVEIDHQSEHLSATVFCFDSLFSSDRTNRIVGLQCKHHAESTISVPSTSDFAVHRLAKCCRTGWHYDLMTRRCIPITDATANVNTVRQTLLQTTDDTVILFEVHKPDCNDATDVFVEYLSDRHSLRLHKNGLDLWSRKHGESEHLEAGEFCLDVAIDASDASQQQQLIVRSCRRQSICDRIACVRRCCRNDQMLERQNGTSVCVPYERNIRPRFYDLQAPLSGDPEMTPPPEVDVPGMCRGFFCWVGVCACVFIDSINTTK